MAIPETNSCEGDVVVDPTTALGMDPRPGDQDVDTEQTPLLSGSDREGNPSLIEDSDISKVVESPASSTTHYRNISRRQFCWVFGGILFGDLIAFFDSTLMASAHPVITSYFEASNAASWLSTVFFLTSTIFQPLAGRVSDTIGRRPVYLFSILTFLLTTLWCAQAQSIGSFIAARAVCGFGAGGVITMSFVIMSDVVKLEYRGIYQSCLNLIYGIGHSLGASLGGVLCDKLGWRSAFLIQLPFIFIYLLIAAFTTPADLGPNLMKEEGKTILEAVRAFDLTGSLALTFVVSGLILGLNLGGSIFPWTHPIVIISLICFAVASPVLVIVERRASRPILPIKLLSTIPIANVMISNFLGAIVTQTILFNVPLFLQAVLLFSPSQSGLCLISPLIGLTATAVTTGFWITKSRNMKKPMVVGVMFYLLGSSLTATLSTNSPLWAILCFLIPGASTGQGFLGPSSSIAVLALSSQDEQAVVTTTLALLRNLGTVMGVAISSWVLQNSLIITLDRYVTGPHKEEVVMMVRKSARAVLGLKGHYQVQVVQAYAEALRVTFISGIVFAVLLVVLILPIRLPKLAKSGN